MRTVRISRKWALLGVLAIVATSMASGLCYADQKPEGLEMPAKLLTLKAPVAVTTIGQAPGAMMVRLLLQKSKIQVTQNDMLTAKDIAEAAKNPSTAYKTLIMTMGTSLKGMGGAGVEIDSEVQRCNALVAEAKKHGMTIVGVQIDGASRRTDEYDEKSNRAVAPQSNLLIVMKEVDKDSYFTNVAKQKGIPIVRAAKSVDFGYAFSVLFNTSAK